MKEFIEKLIGRLEYLQKDKYVLAPTVCYVLEGVKRYVNQLAEEYNNDFCEWKMLKANARLRHKNCMFAEDTVDPWKFNFCPYCGKQIKVAPYQPKGE